MSEIKKIFDNSTYFVTAIVIAIGLTLCGLAVGNGIRYLKNFDRYVEVKGLAEQTVKSNQASLQIGFTAASNNLTELSQTVNKEQETIVTFLHNQGFKDNEIQKDPVSIMDNSTNSYNSNSKATRYSANGSVTVVSNDVDNVTKASQLTNNLIQDGVVISNNNINYMYTNLNDVKAPMLNQALSNAKIAALEFSNNSQSKLGKIKYATQGLFTITPLNETSPQGTSIYKKVRVVTTVQFFLK